MKHLITLSILLFLLNSSASAQGENNIWAFGKGFGLDFSSGTPVRYGTALNTIEGSASVCGRNGKIKFYSDGVKAFNRNNKVMPNGLGLLTNTSMTQGVAIVPFVNDTNKYYLFVIHTEGPITSAQYLNYSVIDMRLDGGLGDIVDGEKNIQIDDSLSEKMLVTRGPACDYWLVVHAGYKPEFHAFRISADGVNTNPVITTTAYTGDGKYGIGEMKISQANDRIVLANWRSRGTLGTIELFDFDSTRGTMSNYRLVDSSKRYAAYGIEFSPDGTKLYAGYGEDEPRPPYSLVQFNIGLLPDIALVRSTQTVLGTSYNWGGMRRYRGKIYTVSHGVIGVVNDPNLPGLSCNFDNSGIVGTAIAELGFGLGNPVPETLPSIKRVKDTSICTGITYTGEPGFRHYTWSDGDTGFQKNIIPPAAVWVKADNGACGAETIDTFHVQAKSLELDLGESIVLCKDQTVTLDSKMPGMEYLWNTGATTASIGVDRTGDYTLQVRSGDCIASDTISVRLGDCDKCIDLPTAFTPNGDGRNDVFRGLTRCPVLNYTMKIFNRYGQEVFSTTSPSTGWDGTFQGNAEELGVYFYLVKVRFDKPGGTEELYKGDVSLLR